jgi:WhiB family transcriptional regulator, redox-sensing transcriptional regulator
MTDWRDNARCRGMDLCLFFPTGGDNGITAKHICQLCEVRVECLADALATNDRHGVRGGLSAKQRRQLHRRLQQPRVRHTPQRDAEIARLTRCGLTARQIGARFGLTPRSVCRARDRAKRTAA